MNKSHNHAIIVRPSGWTSLRSAQYGGRYTEIVEGVCKLKKLLMFVGMLSVSTYSLGDAATYDSSWQWNRNVTIEKIQVLWDVSDTRINLSNGEICRINKTDKELFSIALAMKAQGTVGEVICQKDTVGGGNERRAHRLTF